MLIIEMQNISLESNIENIDYYFNPKSVHAFKKKNKFFLFCVDNLSIFELNEIAYRIFKTLHPINLKNLKHKQQYSNYEIIKTLEELLNWGLIYDRSIPNISTDRNSLNEDIYLTGLYLVISQDCNLRCKYCSAEFGRFGLKPKSRFMSRHIAKKSIDFFLKKLSNEVENPWISFDGGEPLLNFSLIKFIIEYVRKIKSNVSYSLYTNGTLMDDEKAKWFAENGINVTFSIDGTKKIHDRNRIYKNGKGSYENAVKGIKAYQKFAKYELSAKTSIPKGKNLNECVHNLWNLGMSSVILNCTAESSFVDTQTYRMNKTDFVKFFKQWESLNLEILNQLIEKGESPLIHLTKVYLESLAKRKISPKGCGIGRTVSITPDGTVYLCNGLTGCKDYILGDIFNGLNENYFESFYKIYNKYLHKCDDCWAKNICGTGCMAQSIKYNELDDSYEPSRLCEINKKAIETVIYMYYRLKEQRPELLNGIMNQKF